ncbi:MAG: NAD(P)-dependent oxidoreductase [Sulfuricellaceae bacterium]
MTDVIVTGATGFIGKALVQRLLHMGVKAIPLGSLDGDVAEAATWESLPKVAAVVHLAGRSYVPDSWSDGASFIRTNVLGTEQALAYCRRQGARLVYVSAYVYGIPSELPIAETHPIMPNNPYALSKRMAEQLCEFASRFQGVSVTVLRIFNVYGPGQRPEFLIPSIIRQVKEGKEIRVMDLKPRRDFVYLDDVVDAIVKALSVTQGFNLVNIGSGKSLSVEEIIGCIQAAAGTDLPVVSEATERPQEIPDVRADITLAKRVLGWAPQLSFLSGINRLLNVE